MAKAKKLVIQLVLTNIIKFLEEYQLALVSWKLSASEVRSSPKVQVNLLHTSTIHHDIPIIFYFDIMLVLT